MRSAVHLSKGCYRGQETVAKVHNLGHPPRRLVFLHLDGTDNVLPAPGDEVVLPAESDVVGGDPDVVGNVTSTGIHYELGPIALAVVRRSTPVERDLGVLSDGIVVAAGQEVIVPPEAGSVVGRIRRMPRLGVMRR
jgi:folate-binding Fe-S cluster repair protein YgfZ